MFSQHSSHAKFLVIAITLATVAPATAQTQGVGSSDPFTTERPSDESGLVIPANFEKPAGMKETATKDAPKYTNSQNVITTGYVPTVEQSMPEVASSEAPLKPIRKTEPQRFRPSQVRQLKPAAPAKTPKQPVQQAKFETPVSREPQPSPIQRVVHQAPVNRAPVGTASIRSQLEGGDGLSNSFPTQFHPPAGFTVVHDAKEDPTAGYPQQEVRAALAEPERIIDSTLRMTQVSHTGPYRGNASCGTQSGQRCRCQNRRGCLFGKLFGCDLLSCGCCSHGSSQTHCADGANCGNANCSNSRGGCCHHHCGLFGSLFGCDCCCSHGGGQQCGSANCGNTQCAQQGCRDDGCCVGCNNCCIFGRLFGRSQRQCCCGGPDCRCNDGHCCPLFDGGWCCHHCGESVEQTQPECGNCGYRLSHDDGFFGGWKHKYGYSDEHPCVSKTPSPWRAGAEVVFLKPYSSIGTRGAIRTNLGALGQVPGLGLTNVQGGEVDSEFSPGARFWVERSGSNGFGVRVRYTTFGQDEDNSIFVTNALGNTTVGRSQYEVDAELFDLEFTNRMQFDKWSAVVFSGIRHADFREHRRDLFQNQAVVGLEQKNEMDGFGMLIGGEIGRRRGFWTSFVSGRASLILGDGFSQLRSDSVGLLNFRDRLEDEIRPIYELQAGLRYARDFGAHELLLTTAVEAQYWDKFTSTATAPGLGINGRRESVGFLGLDIGLGIGW